MSRKLATKPRRDMQTGAKQEQPKAVLVLANPSQSRFIAEAMQGADLKNFALLQKDVTEEEERAYLERMQDEGSVIYLIVVDGRIIGTAGLHEVNKYMRTARVGMTIFHSEDRGHHYGKQAMTQLIELAFTVHGIERLEGMVVATNFWQITWDKSFGFKREGLARGKYLRNGERLDMVMLGLLKTDWEKQTS